MILRDLLFEIGTEEIPARFMTWAIEELERLARADLETMRVSYSGLRVTGTPRRIVLYVKDLADRQEDLEESVKGPPKTQALDASGAYTKAALGFAKSRNADVKDLRFEEVKGVEYLFAVVRESGRMTSDLLPDFLTNLIKKLTFPKSMYWDSSSVRFARPVRWIVALFDSELVPLSFGNVISGYTSRGHRFMGHEQTDIPSASEYWSIMESEMVIVDHERRKEMIRSGIAEIEKEIGKRADTDSDLLEENAQLVEYPVPFCGSFEESFLDIPEEVLIATMKKNQRYFPMRDDSGRLAAAFIGVSNNKAKDMAVVRGGNERVLRARLHDAEFFWKEDRARSLESRIPELAKVLYQEQLGSVLDKSRRAGKLSQKLASALGMESLIPSIDRAAALAKADLVTGMVFEFPEVQGVMGREYAKLDGEGDNVANAIYEQYLPRFAGDDLPKGMEGAIIGICDRVDTITAIQKIGMSPTGSQDPYALRRAARCINEIVWGLALDIDISELFRNASELLGADDESLKKSMDFYRLRLHNQLRERGFAHGATSLAVSSMGHRPLQAMRMLEAFNNVTGAEWFGSLVLSAIRVSNILNKLSAEELEASELVSDELSEQAEKELLEALSKQSVTVRSALDSCDWEAICGALSKLSPAISGFFDSVMVMDENLSVRNNRLALLKKCRELFDSIGDFALLK